MNLFSYTSVDMIMMSPVFSALAFFAAVAFVLFVSFAALRKRRQLENYEQLLTEKPTNLFKDEEPSAIDGNGSYQQSGGLNPMASNDQKTVTYCMIDGRLLDEQ